MNKISLTSIILTFNEELHIERCLKNVCLISEKVYVIDCFSKDRTCEIASKFENVEVVQHEWPGNQAAQFNWFIDNHEIASDWILRLDADEYLSGEAVKEITETLPSLPQDVTGCVMKRDIIFLGRRIKHGKLKTIKLLRIWRTGKGRIENREMDEHAILTEGRSIELKNWFFDDNLNGIDAWIRKHLDYANRESKSQLLNEATTTEASATDMGARNKQKSRYYSLPKFWRGFMFFVLRYIFLGGFLDGKQGFVWNFMQCWWYRTLVDVKIEETITKA
ncbi:MAG: glycosyltransferase family 2 protein [Bacteroidales bacterium]|nr:glycosyltransferase family 2 protein [Bacteroidales bacterium]